MSAKRGRENERGVALILVLGAIAILTVMLTDFQDEATGELSAALADRDAVKAEYLAKSGVNLGRLLIASEPIIRQGIALIARSRQVPVWEFSDRILGAFNDKEGGESFASLTNTDISQGKNLGINGGHFEVNIVDEDSKLNVNVAARGEPFTQLRLGGQLTSLLAGDQYAPMFEQRDRDDNFTDRAAVVSALIDWADGNEDAFSYDPTGSAPPTQAAEDNSYQLLKTPYFRKNAAYDSLEELHLVRGISDDFWATFVDPDPEKPKKRVMTIWGQGAVNVNSAPAQTLLAVVCSGVNVATTKMCNDPLEAQKFLMGVTLVRSFLAGIPMFGSGGEFIKAMQGQGQFGGLFKMMGVEPIVFKSADLTTKAVTAESKMFSIYSDGIVSGYQRKTRVRIHTVVDFRQTPAPAAATSPTTAGAAPAASAGGAGASAPVTGSAQLDAIVAAQNPDPGGTIVYYRME